MDAIICSVEDNKLIKRITVRQFCKDEMLKDIAIAVAVTTLEIIEQMEDLKVYEGHYVENPENSHYFLSTPIEISYAVLYKTKEAREKLIDLIKNIDKY